MSGLIIYPELKSGDFDYDSILNGKNFETITGIPVKIDKIIRDITGEAVLAISGTMSLQGTRIRAVWNLSGQILEYRRFRNFLMPFKNWSVNMQLDEDMLQLVNIEKLDNK